MIPIVSFIFVVIMLYKYNGSGNLILKKSINAYFGIKIGKADQDKN